MTQNGVVRPSIRYVFLDMDGVVADFVKGANLAHNSPDPYLESKNWGVYEVADTWGISWDQFWEPILPLGAGFWRSLDKTSEADLLVRGVEKRWGTENVAFLTNPSRAGGEAVTGKQEWLARYYPELKEQVIFTQAKKFLAAPDRLLVDDQDRNVNAWRAAGGKAILVPRRWNSLGKGPRLSTKWLWKLIGEQGG